MFTNPDLTALSSNLAPLIVTSPIIRSGTTLLQRLLCSNRNALIYGENIASDFELQLNVYVSKLMFYNHNRESFELTRQMVINEKRDEWMTDLAPDLTGYLNTLGEVCLGMLYHCQEYAFNQGYLTWGFKYPGWSTQSILLTKQVLPQARFLYIYRDIVECLKSAKTWQPSWSDRELVRLCEEWVRNLQFALSLTADSSVLVIEYEKFIQYQSESIKQIETFTGLQPLDKEVFSRKINNPSNKNTPYVQPSNLTSAEIEIVERITSPLRTRLYAVR